MHWTSEIFLMYTFLPIKSSQKIVPLTLVVATLIQASSCSSLLLDNIADVVKSVTALAPDIGDLSPDLLQTVVTPGTGGPTLLQACCGPYHFTCCGGFQRPPSTSLSFDFVSTGVPGVAGSSPALGLAPGLALGVIKGLLIGNKT